MCRGWSQHQHPPSPTCCPAQPSWQIHHWAINSLDRKSETAKGSLKMWTSIMNAAMVSFASVSMAWVMQWQTISKPRKCTQQKQAQQLDALLLSPVLSWGRQPHVKPKSSQAKWKEKIGDFVNTLPWTKAEVKDICHTVLDLEWSGVGFLDLAIVVLRVVWNAGATSNINSRWKHPIQLWKPMQTQPLSNCMLLACAYQSARQRSMGIAEKTCEGCWRLLGKGRLFARPFFKTNPQELSTLCIYPKQLLKHTKNVSINKTLSITTHAQYVLSCNFGGKSQEQQWHLLWSILENMQWKEMHQLFRFGLGVVCY